MQADLVVSDAVVSSKGQVTLPAAMRAQLGIGPGSHIRFELRGVAVKQPDAPVGVALAMPQPAAEEPVAARHGIHRCCGRAHLRHCQYCGPARRRVPTMWICAASRCGWRK